MRLIIMPLFITILMQFSASGQKKYIPKFSDPLLEEFRWQHHEELSGKNFQFFCEGPDGSMWFGIKDGVMSYDGYTWTEYTIPEEKRGMSNIKGMTFLGDTLYIAGDGLQKFHNGLWSDLQFKLSPENNFDDMLINGHFFFHDLRTSGDILLGATTYGLYLYVKGKHFFYTNEEVKQRQDALFENLEVRAINSFGTGIKYFFSNILDLGNQTFYGFLSNNNTTQQHFKFRIIDDPENPLQLIDDIRDTDIKTGGPISSIVLPNGEIWLVSESYDVGLNIFKNNKWEITNFKEVLNDSEVCKHILRLDDGSIIITSSSVLYRYHDGNWSKITSPSVPFKSNQLFAKYSNNGDLWLGDSNGEVYSIDYSDKHYASYEDLSYQFTDKNNTVWFISKDNKVVYQENSAWYYFDESDGLISAPQVLFESKNGTIWCGGSNKKEIAATAYLNENNQWVDQSHPQISWGINYNAIADNKHGLVWFGGAPNPKEEKKQIGGIINLELTPERLETSSFFNRNPRILSLVNSEKTLYVGTKDGLFNFENDKLTKVEEAPVSSYYRITTTNTSSYWAATLGAGIVKINDDHFKSHTVKNGLITNVIYDVYAQSDSSIWVASNKGFSYFNGKYWNNDIYPKAFNIGIESGRLSGHGKNIWISKFPLKWTRRIYEYQSVENINGDFYSITIKRDTKPPNTQVTFYKKNVDASGNTNIEWKGIDYMGHTSADNLSFSYRINNQEWSTPSPKKNINLSGLNSGEYLFEVRALDKDMNYDASPSSISFVVAPPVWKRTRFILLIGSMMGTIFFLIRRIVVRNKRLGVLNGSLTEANNEIRERQIKIGHQAEKLKTFNEALIELNEKLESKILERTKELEDHAFYNSHELRKPVSNILGLVQLIKDSGKTYVPELMEALYKVTNNLDSKVRMIQAKLRIKDE